MNSLKFFQTEHSTFHNFKRRYPDGPWTQFLNILEDVARWIWTCPVLNPFNNREKVEAGEKRQPPNFRRRMPDVYNQFLVSHAGCELAQN